MTTTRGLTLIEILISLGIGMMLAALGTSALLHVSKTLTHNRALLQGHDDAAIIATRLQATLGAVYQPALMRCRADPGADATWGTGDERIDLTWMASVRSLDESTMTYGPKPMNDLIWHRLSWSGDGDGGGDISMAYSTGRRVIDAWSFILNGISRRPSIALGPFVRRDRRRDLNDNDLRYLPGMNLATYNSVGAKGDEADLDARLTPWHSPTTRVTTFRLEFVDQGGFVVHCNPASGISITDPNGASIPLLGTPTANATVYTFEGVWLDGRLQAPADASGSGFHRRSSAAQRPALIRIAFDLVMGTAEPRAPTDRDPRLPFTVTICPSFSLPPL
jgi:hypothetical protein